jgi:hypothetical protein
MTAVTLSNEDTGLNNTRTVKGKPVGDPPRSVPMRAEG